MIQTQQDFCGAALVPFAPQVFLVDAVAHGLAVAAFVVALEPCAWLMGGPGPVGRGRPLTRDVSRTGARCRGSA
jgi:hypothetical protein